MTPDWSQIGPRFVSFWSQFRAILVLIWSHFGGMLVPGDREKGFSAKKMIFIYGNHQAEKCDL